MRIESHRLGGGRSSKFFYRRRRALFEALEQRQLLSSGDPVTSFGTNGATQAQYQGPLISVPQSVTTDSLGRTIEAGLADESGEPSQIAVARYTSSGALDTSFAVGGKATIAVGYTGWANAITTDTQNRVIIVGYEQPQYLLSAAPDQFFVMRLTSSGALDTSFNGSGIETLSFNGLNAQAEAVTIQADGKIVVAGGAIPSANASTGVAIARLNTDGSLDTSFGGSGTGEVITQAGTSGSEAYGIALDASQRIVVTGNDVVGHTSTLVMRYNTDGTLDSSFGNGGIVTVPVTNSQSYGYSIAFAQSGQIVVGGAGLTFNSSTYTYPTGRDIAVLRLNGDGSLDSSFGNGGSETIDFNAKDQYATSLRVLANGDELIAGSQITSAGEVSMVVALTPSGAIDPTYNQTGLANAIAGGFEAAIGSDGTVTLAGTLGSNGESFAVGRITSTGGVDTTFGTNGVNTTDFIGTLTSDERAVALQSDGKTIIAGSATQNTGTVAAISRFNTDGSLDTSFGSGGMVTSAFMQAASALVLQPDGKILLAGTANDSTGTTANYDMVVVRLNADGSIDTTFGTNGEVTIDQVLQYPYYQHTDDEAFAIALTPDGHIIVGGYTSQNVNGYDAVGLVRLTSSGAIDTSFGTSGRASPYFSDSVVPKSLAIDASGRIVLSGYAQNSSLQSQMFLARFTSNGAADTTFATNGFWVSNFSSGAVADSLAIQPNGSIDIGGEVSAGGYENFTVARFTASGVLDSSFNTSGYFINPAIQSEAGAVVATADGGVLAGGGAGKIYLEKFTASGSLDSTFGTGGVASSNVSLASIASNTMPPVIAIRPNGYIVAAATGETAFGSGFSATAAEFEGYSNPATGLVSGTVFRDFNGSGSPSSPVVGVPGVTVYLDLNSDGTLDSNDPRAVTTSTGQFMFSGLAPATYTVREIYPSTFYTTTGAFITVTVTPTQPTPVILFGLAEYSTLTGVVYNDQLGSGFQTGNAGLPNVTVFLDVNQDGIFDAGDLSTVTDVNGNYSLSNCPAGTFTLSEVVPAGAIITQPQYVGSPGYYTVTLGTLLPTAKPFGDFTLGTASGIVFNDLNNNGVQDSSEPGLAGVTVFADVNGTGVLASNDPTAITDANGHYQLTNLSDGTVSLFAVSPSGFVPAANSSATRIYSGTTLSYSFAERATGASISGRIFGDSNGNGVQDSGEGPLTATVFLDVNHNGGFYSNDPSVVSSSVDGSFSFTGLSAGTYTVALLLPTGWQAESATGYFSNVTVTAGNASSGIVFAVKPIVVTNLLTGTVIGTNGSYGNVAANVAASAFDDNLSSFFDGPSASGDWVGLDFGAPKAITSLAYSSRSGWSSRMNGGVFQASNSATFSSGDATLYTIGQTANPSSGILTTQTVSNNTAYRYVRYVGPTKSYGDVAEVQFFGHTPVTTDSISGVVTGAPAGTTVYLDVNNNSKLDSGEIATTTGANGAYSFSNVATGSYVIRQVLPAGYTQSTPTSNGGYSITVSNGSTFTAKNFTDKATATLTKFTGTTIGTSGSFQNDGNTIVKATDGNLTTFFDGSTGNGNWVGLDLGSTKIVKQIEYAPRSGWASRMVGGIFQASNSATFASGVVNLYTVTSTPTQNVLATVSVSVTTAYRYVRYLSPNGSYGDVAEIQFFG